MRAAKQRNGKLTSKPRCAQSVRFSQPVRQTQHPSCDLPLPLSFALNSRGPYSSPSESPCAGMTFWLSKQPARIYTEVSTSPVVSNGLFDEAPSEATCCQKASLARQRHPSHFLEHMRGMPVQRSAELLFGACRDHSCHFLRPAVRPWRNCRKLDCPTAERRPALAGSCQAGPTHQAAQGQ